MLLEEERIQVVRYCKEMEDRNLTKGTGGNVSVYNREMGLIAMSASGVEYRTMTPGQVTVVDISGNTVDGDMIPSSEMWLHLAAYKENDSFNAIVHTHSTYCTIAACMEKDVPAVHYLIGVCGGDHLPCIPYCLYGSKDLAEGVAAQYRKEPQISAMLLGNHGLVAAGKNVKHAFNQCVELEFVCELYVNLLKTGNMNVLTPEQMALVIEKFKGYGQKK